MLWEFEGRRYPFAGLDMSVRDIMEFQAEAISFTEPTTIRSFDDLARVGRELVGLPKAERKAHPDFGLWTVAMLWSAMRAAGVPIRFSEMLDWPASRMESVRPILQPEDLVRADAEGKGQAPASGAGNRAARRAKKRR